MREGARLEAVTSAGLQSRTRGQWARLLLAIYGPTLLASIGFGAIIPLIPLQATTLDQWQPGQAVNIEVDLIARYLERLLLGERAAAPSASLTREFLAVHGFLKN